MRLNEESWIWELQKEQKFLFVKWHPLGDPVEVTVRGYELSLRKADAQMIISAITIEFYK